MSTSTAILSRTPLLPLSHILKNLSIQDILNVSSEDKSLKWCLRALGMRSGGFNVILEDYGFQINMLSLGYGFQWYTNPNAAINVFHERLNHFMDVFPGEINKLTVCPISYSQQIPNLPKVCNVLSVGEEQSAYGDEDLEMKDVCSVDTLDALLSHVDFKQGLVLNGPMELKTRSEKIYDVEYLKINNSWWMKAPLVQRLQNKVIQLGESELSDTDVNAILHNLNNGTGNDRLRVMTIHKEAGWCMESVLEGLNSTQVEEQVYSMDCDRSLYESFLSISYSYGNQFRNAHNFTTVNGAQVSVDEFYSVIRIHIWEKEAEKEKEMPRKRKSDDSTEPTTKKQRLFS